MTLRAPRFQPAPVGLLHALLVLTACRDLAHIPAGQCGNRVIESGEQCDEGPDSPTCHAPGTDHACEFDCSTHPCPRGASCGVDAVCRAPTGTLAMATVEGGESYAYLRSGDLSGDRRDDLLMTSLRGVTITFDAARAPTVLRDDSLASWLTVLGEVDGDGRKDAIAYGASPTEVQVLRADEGGALTPVSHFFRLPETDAPPEAVRRLCVADLNADGRAEPLLMIDADLFSISSALAVFDSLGRLTVPAADMAGNIAHGEFVGDAGCEELALGSAKDGTLHVYALCDGPVRERAVVSLPGDLGAEGVFGGDVDGDGKLDLIAANANVTEAPFVAYGLGDGTFDSRITGRPAAFGDNRAANLPYSPRGSLLGVAMLDDDAKIDFQYDGSTVLTSKVTPACERDGDVSCFLGHDYWLAAAAGDFNRDGIPDQIGIGGFDARELTFALGTGDGFNAFAIPTEGVPVALTGPTLSVGDFDGDLTLDVAFAETLKAQQSQTAATVLFGQALGKPTEQRRLGKTTGDLTLATGNLLEEPGRRMDDLVLLADTPTGQGVGLFAGQTSRVLYSPLPLPEDAATREYLSIASVALGRFRGPMLGGDANDDHASPWLDLALAATNERKTGWYVYFVPNSPDGFLSAKTDEPPLRIERPVPSDSTGPLPMPLLFALDVDGDGVDELIVLPSAAEGSRLAYWLVERDAQGFTQPRGYAVDLPTLPANAPASVWTTEAPCDIDGDGRLDLAVALSEFPERGEARGQLLVLRATADGRLGAPTLFELPPEVLGAEVASNLYSDTFAFANIDGEPDLELALGMGNRIVLAKLDFASGTVQRIAELDPAGYTYTLTSGDYDGDGVDDLAVSVDSGLRVFWQEARAP